VFAGKSGYLIMKLSRNWTPPIR